MTRIMSYLACLGVLATPALAAEPCAPRDAIVSQIAKGYHEQSEAIGVTNAGALVEVFVSPEGTWTILLSSPQGTSCIAAVGEAWERKAAAKGPQS